MNTFVLGVHKPQKNFIKENIKRVKGCNHCDRSKENQVIGATQVQKDYHRVKSVKYRINEQQPVIKCNVKFVGREKPEIFKNVQNNVHLSTIQNQSNCYASNGVKSYRNQECQTDDALYNNNNNSCTSNNNVDELKSSCTVCGRVVNRRNAALQVEIPVVPCDGSILPDTFNHAALNTVSFCNDEKTDDISTEQFSKIDNKKDALKENIFKKTDSILKPSLNYRLGIVPRYLKERNARCEQEKKITQEKEKMEELLGIKDPDCPPGHMLMQERERVERLKRLQKEFDEEIRKLNTIPVSSDTYRVRQKKAQIEKELNRIEEAMNSLKRLKVFVKIENV